MTTTFESSPPQWQGADEQFPEGRIGARFGSLVVSTPNATVMYAPLYDTDVTLRMREGCHFGAHDPFVHPQPHHGPTRHLLCAPTPTTIGENAILFLQLRPRIDWQAKFGDGVAGLGRIDAEKVKELVERGTQLLEGVDRLVEDAKEGRIQGVARDLLPNEQTKRYKWYLKFFLRAVAQEGSFDDCELRWSNARRIQLDICAFIEYLRVYRILFHEPPIIPRPTDNTLMGCITNNYIVASEVYAVGLPVWFVYKGLGSRPSDFRRFLSERETQNLIHASSIPPRPIQMGDPLAEKRFFSLRRHPHALLLWQGKADDPRRFPVMTQVFRGEKQAIAPHSPPAATNPASGPSSSRIPPTAPTPTTNYGSFSAPLPAQSSKTQSSKRTRVDSNGAASNKKVKGAASAGPSPPVGTARSRFDEPLDQRQVLPAPIQSPSRALERVKQELNLHPNARPVMAKLQGLEPHFAGFAVPDGSQIASMTVEATQAGALLNCVRFRPLWHYRARSIMSPACSVEFVKAQVWRSVLGLDVVGQRGDVLEQRGTQQDRPPTRKRQGQSSQEKRDAALETLNQTMGLSGIKVCVIEFLLTFTD